MGHNKPIDTISDLVHVGEGLKSLWTIDRAATDWYSEGGF